MCTDFLHNSVSFIPKDSWSLESCWDINWSCDLLAEKFSHGSISGNTDIFEKFLKDYTSCAADAPAPESSSAGSETVFVCDAPSPPSVPQQEPLGQQHVASATADAALLLKEQCGKRVETHPSQTKRKLESPCDSEGCSSKSPRKDNDDGPRPPRSVFIHEEPLVMPPWGATTRENLLEQLAHIPCRHQVGHMHPCG